MESSHRNESGSGYWQLQLDRDLVDTISSIYPEWFEADGMADGGGGGEGRSPPPPLLLPPAAGGARESPPKAVVDSSPIVIDQNKQSLKVKLLLRRPFDQLVAQGIMPPHKTPAAFHGQRRQLERAKTGDMLKAKIQQRPPRQELERRHILEVDPSHVDPSLAERQRMLKKAKLADHLNDQLSHRPGPLELIQKNILHTEEPIEEAVKTGRIPYKATCEGQLHRPQLPSNYINPEEDSQSSEGDSRVSPGPCDVLETAAKSAGIVVSLIQPSEGGTVVLSKDSEIVFADLCRSVAAPLLPQVSIPVSIVSSTSSLSPLSSVASPAPSVVSPAPPPLLARAVPSPIKTESSSKDKNRKKSKCKSLPKARTIKFHEYKGPPSAHKNPNPAANPEESSYDLLLKQQTLLLQFQLQLQHKYPQIILPASQKVSSGDNSNASSTNTSHSNMQQLSPAPSTSSESSVPAARITARLEDMKVSDLKAELKRRSLPVSGSKPQLIERLRPFSDQNPSSIDSSVHSTNSPLYQDIDSPPEAPCDERMDLDPVSPAPQMDPYQQALQKSNEEIVREQQRQIEELQRELTLSQLKLQAATRAEPKAEMLALQKHLQARQQQQQQQRQQENFALQMKQLQGLQARQAQINEEQQRIQQQQQIAFHNQKNVAGGLILNGAEAAMVFNQLMQQGKAKSFPVIKTEFLEEQKVAPQIKIEFSEESKPPPPQYNEATKQMNKKNHIKSQIIDDVLEILIKNGELPASAANDPLTPNSAGTKSNEPVYPGDIHNNNNNVMVDPSSPEAALGIDPTDLLESLDNLENMDFSQLVMELGGSGGCPAAPSNGNAGDDMAMDTDEWLESLLPCDSFYESETGGGQMGRESDPSAGCDPLLGIAHDPFDPFSLDEFRAVSDLGGSLSWDKIDYAA
ncbi:unnamed protein product [Phaedon cochleariae]|uniref:SAP domain-containing protein n=1 Tax=Phaedon cochleariae TaxID=80249 RepID=A0A9P0DRS9_PHACE|nr:unnamed protein product [Phaedon cochleariae]